MDRLDPHHKSFGLSARVQQQMAALEHDLRVEIDIIGRRLDGEFVGTAADAARLAAWLNEVSELARVLRGLPPHPLR